MRYGLRSLLVLVALAPPAIAGLAFRWRAIADDLANGSAADWQPLLFLTASLAALITLVTAVGAISRWTGSA